MHFMKWARLMLPVVFKEFELVCIFLLFFSIQYHCQLVKGQKSGGAAAPPAPPVSTGLIYVVLLWRG